ncbi:hypothetical protein ACH4RG_35015 [Streptomyces sp. NPDC021019]|uniref:hypothetical protein n=1 Tax=Streptomyces sp. NPDC021019 TaxID=3365108 RepID=UPI0037BAF7B0
MTTESELSGVDLARQALLAARETARKNGATAKKPKRRTTTAVRRDGREPLGLGRAIGMMMTERGMAAPAAGGSVLADFDTFRTAVVPELAGRVQAVVFDAETGRLDVVPDAPAARTKLRWSAPKLIAAANERVQGANVRALHALAPAPVKAGPATAAAEPAPPPTAPAAPIQRADPKDLIVFHAPVPRGGSCPAAHSLGTAATLPGMSKHRHWSASGPTRSAISESIARSVILVAESSRTRPLCLWTAELPPTARQAG